MPFIQIFSFLSSFSIFKKIIPNSIHSIQPSTIIKTIIYLLVAIILAWKYYSMNSIIQEQSSTIKNQELKIQAQESTNQKLQGIIKRDFEKLKECSNITQNNQEQIQKIADDYNKSINIYINKLKRKQQTIVYLLNENKNLRKQLKEKQKKFVIELDSNLKKKEKIVTICKISKVNKVSTDGPDSTHILNSENIR